MASGESGLRTRLLEVVRSTKAQKEPLTAGSEYADTKKVVQSYEEQLKLLSARHEEALAELTACNAMRRHCRLVTDGYEVKGYGLLIPIREDRDIVKELEAVSASLKATGSLALYLDAPDHIGGMKLYPYPVKELSMFFPEPLSYCLLDEIEKMVKAFRAAYAVQVYAGGIRSIEQAIGWEENASMIVGNVELAERLKESDTTLLVGMAAAQAEDERPRAKVKLPEEKSQAEIERALQEMAGKDLEIETPSKIGMESPLGSQEHLTGVDAVNVKSPRKKIKRKEKKKPVSKPKVVNQI